MTPGEKTSDKRSNCTLAVHAFIEEIGKHLSSALHHPTLAPSLICSPSIARVVFPEYQWIHDVCKAHQWLLIILKIKTKALQMIYRALEAAHPPALFHTFVLLPVDSSQLVPLSDPRMSQSLPPQGFCTSSSSCSGYSPSLCLVSFYFRSQPKCGFLREPSPTHTPASVTSI